MPLLRFVCASRRIAARCRCLASSVPSSALHRFVCAAHRPASPLPRFVCAVRCCAVLRRCFASSMHRPAPRCRAVAFASSLPSIAPPLPRFVCASLCRASPLLRFVCAARRVASRGDAVASLRLCVAVLGRAVASPLLFHFLPNKPALPAIPPLADPLQRPIIERIDYQLFEFRLCAHHRKLYHGSHRCGF